MLPRTHAKWSFLRSLTFRHLQLQLPPRPNHSITHCTSSPQSFAITDNTLSATTSVTGGSPGLSALELRASFRRNSLVRSIVDASDAYNSGTLVLTMATTISGGRVMVGYGLAMIRFRKSVLRRWPLRVPLPSCSSMRRFYSRGHPLHVSRQSGDLKKLSGLGIHSLRNPNPLMRVVSGRRAKFPVQRQAMYNLELLGTSLLDGPRVHCRSQSRNLLIRLSQHHR